MAVNLSAPDPKDLRPVAGVRLGVAEAGIRKTGRRDLTVISLAPGSRVAGVFTQNRFCAAPVQVCREHLAGEMAPRALVINTGVANAGTGAEGLEAARRTCRAVSQVLGVEPEEVLPFSTGVILEPLPVEKIEAALAALVTNLRSDAWAEAAQAIMTTDTVPKACSRQVRLSDGAVVTITGISKGAGMIRPNMATMLGFVATDAKIAKPLLDTLVREAADESFNAITVDGDTSTNDSFVLIATGAAMSRELAASDDEDYRKVRSAVIEVSRRLAQAIVRDGEGATKFITVRVEGGTSREECRKVAYAIAHSPLVKTAFFASDPNLGRILAAIGYAGIDDLDPRAIRVWLEGGDDSILVAEGGGRADSYREDDGARVMKHAEITVRVDLGRGEVAATVWTCDLSFDYVRINAEYRS